jgi:ribosomal protein S18 acetylase RimI-like enzyme
VHPDSGFDVVFFWMIKAFVINMQAFEADVFGAPVWRVEVNGDKELEATLLNRLIDQARDESVALISVRVPADTGAGNAWSCAGFRMIERLLTFWREIPEELAPVMDVTVASQNDAEACANIARRSFYFDRFHADPCLSGTVADEIKSRWARNGVNGRADAPLIVRKDGAVAGFNLCMRKGEDAVIDLIAVDRAWQGRGLGRKLVEGAFAHYAGSARVMWVSTQESNAASIALYKSTGFEFHSAAHTWHWTP